MEPSGVPFFVFHPAFFCYHLLMDALNRIISETEALLEKKGRVVIAVDGKSGTGKSHLSRLIRACIPCGVVHMDDFFLPPWKRTEQRLLFPGGNLDSERFYEEVALPLKNGARKFAYRPFDCSSMSLADGEREVCGDVVLVEGVYSLLPPFRPLYDFGCILEAPYQDRLSRIMARSGSRMLERFVNEWIPLEDEYFGKLDFTGYLRIKNT